MRSLVIVPYDPIKELSEYLENVIHKPSNNRVSVVVTYGYVKCLRCVFRKGRGKVRWVVTRDVWYDVRTGRAYVACDVTVCAVKTCCCDAKIVRGTRRKTTKQVL